MEKRFNEKGYEVVVRYNVEHISIQDCCTEAVLSAFSEAYGKDIVYLSGIDCDLYTTFNVYK